MSRVRFADRREAGRLLATRLAHVEPGAVVVGLPRGGVPVAAEVARALGAPLDVIVVRKLGVPGQPELAMGAIGEGGARVLDEDLVRRARVPPAEVARVEQAERAELERRSAAFRGEHDRLALQGRTVVVVDDGVATGSTARAACMVARAAGAGRVVLAVPVAPVGWEARFRDVADELVCVATPHPFMAVGSFYDDFSQTSDEEVLALLASLRPVEPAAPVDDEVELRLDGAVVHGHLTAPPGARAAVVFAHGSGSSRHSRRNLFVAGVLHDVGIATLLFDLLTPDEEVDRANVFDISLLAGRLAGAMTWLGRTGAGSLPLGLFGASTGAAAALVAAAEAGSGVGAVVSRGGRPDLAGPWLESVRAPTLLVVGGDDHQVLDLNRQAMRALRCPVELVVVPGAGHLFEEPGTLAAAAERARDWFLHHLVPPEAGTG